MITPYNKFLYAWYEYKVKTILTLLDLGNLYRPMQQYTLFVTTAGHLLALRTWASRLLDNTL